MLFALLLLVCLGLVDCCLSNSVVYCCYGNLDVVYVCYEFL